MMEFEVDNDWPAYKRLLLENIKEIKELQKSMSKDIHELKLKEAQREARAKMISTVYGAISGIAIVGLNFLFEYFKNKQQ